MSFFKNIAVPSRQESRKRSEPAAVQPRDPYVPATSAGIDHRTAGLNRTHRYAVGQRLTMAPGGREFARGASICVVVFRLPFEGTTLRYRVRSESENFERIVDEADLSPVRSQP